ncbi:WD40/YVTN/BNR-like repeat-containing protein [Pseudomonadota bacterium]
MRFSLKPRQFAPVLAALALGFSAPLLAQLDARLLEGLSARTLGPAAVSGRITAIDAVSTNPNHIVIGAATGGVWISENGGLTWTPVFDDQPVASIGAVAINQDNPDIIWVGTGEGNVRNSTSIGGGMFKSVDGGKTWQQAGLERTERINRIALHPDNPQVAFAAALGTLWGENEDRGIYKTTDGGRTWRKILFVDTKTGGTDVKIDPFNPDKLYASMWQHRRWPYFFKSGGPGSGMYLSWDGGETWQQKTEHDGLPAGELGRITFAPSPAKKGRVFALAEAGKSAMLRSDDGGQNWIKTNESHNIAERPFYYTEVAADPENPERVYNIFTRLSFSIDGGKTFELNPVVDCCAAGNTIHIDNHAFWINPNDSSHLILGNDGGIAISRDRGETWRFVRNLPLSQFYHVRVDNDTPYNIYGGLQDNGSWRGPSEVWENAGIRNLHWQEVGFGDGFDTLPDPENSRKGYVMSQGGFLSTWNLDTGEQRLIRPAPPEAGVDLRFNWNAAIAQDPFEPATIYYGSQFVHKSTDRGATWSTISGDLTSNNREWQTFRESGGLTSDVTAAENYTSIVSSRGRSGSEPMTGVST